VQTYKIFLQIVPAHVQVARLSICQELPVPQASSDQAYGAVVKRSNKMSVNVFDLAFLFGFGNLDAACRVFSFVGDANSVLILARSLTLFALSSLLILGTLGDGSTPGALRRVSVLDFLLLFWFQLLPGNCSRCHPAWLCTTDDSGGGEVQERFSS
jgi:hypothetical protein